MALQTYVNLFYTFLYLLLNLKMQTDMCLLFLVKTSTSKVYNQCMHACKRKLFSKFILSLSVICCISAFGIFLGFTMQICSKSEWGSTSTVLMFMLYWREQMIANYTYLL